ncbi:MAG: Lon protease family protein [Alphaproteobacteria bacterium]
MSHEREPLAPLPAEALYRFCDAEALGFETSDRLAEFDGPAEGMFGQERALRAIEMGVRMSHDGYNLFVLGPRGTGMQETVRGYLEKLAGGEPVPSDWVYLNNFDDPERPLALRLAPGGGRRLRDGMKAVIEALRASLPDVFSSDDYKRRRKAVEERHDRHQQEAFQAIAKRAEEGGLGLVESRGGEIGVAPVQDGQIMDREEFAALPEEERERLQALMRKIEDSLEHILEELPRWNLERKEEVRKLNEEFTDYVVGQSLGALRRHFEDDAAVLDWLARAHDDIVDHLHLFAPDAQGSGGDNPLALLMGGPPAEDDAAFARYAVNVFVDNAEAEGAPVILEPNPTLANLCGRIEYRTRMNSMSTDFTLIRPGSLQRANGGYLLIDALRLLSEPLAWESLKRALEARKAHIETWADYAQFGPPLTALVPQAVDLNIKVVLFGEDRLFYGLHAQEPDFPDLFKVQAEFSDRIPRDTAAERKLALVLAGRARRDGLKPFTAPGMARVIEQASRRASDAERLSIQIDDLADILREAEFCAREAGQSAVGAAQVEEALAGRRERASRLQEAMREQITRETRVVETEGMRVGQVNALGVYTLPTLRFALPSRVTVRVRPGSGDVMDIDRQVGLTGRIHNKGLEILTSVLKARLGQTRRLGFHATLVFEQRYGRSDGDSASLTELCALLSALGDFPLNQELAATGSINQFGEVQAVGGVNEKIEGFFDLCAERGLTGGQGVLIPAANVKNLMLRPDVVDCVKAGRFRVFSVSTVDEGLELLSGMAAGRRDRHGVYPKNTVYRCVEDRLDAFQALGRNEARRKKRWLF